HDRASARSHLYLRRSDCGSDPNVRPLVRREPLRAVSSVVRRSGTTPRLFLRYRSLDPSVSALLRAEASRARRRFHDPELDLVIRIGRDTASDRDLADAAAPGGTNGINDG